MTIKRKLIVFNHITLDGYFTDSKGDMSWAHRNSNDAEWNEFVAGNAGNGGMLVFGRITYDMMSGYWPSPLAKEQFPVVAQRMNELPKLVFSGKMEKATWNNTVLIKENIADAIKKLKQEPGPDMVILGSGSIVSQLAQENLIDEYQVIVNPIILGKGRTMFETVREKQSLKLTSSRIFGNGNVFLCYEPGSATGD